MSAWTLDRPATSHEDEATYYQEEATYSRAQRSSTSSTIGYHDSQLHYNDTNSERSQSPISLPAATYGPEIHENPQPIAGSERFNTTAVDALSPSGGGGGGGGDDVDNPLYTDPEDRFDNPEGYFSELERLHSLIVNSSSLRLLRETRLLGDYELYVTLPNSSTLSTIQTILDDEIIQICANTTQANRKYSRTVVHLLRCRNIMFGAYDNCCKLIATDFGGHKVNLLVSMQNRERVAELVPYKASSIKHLAEEFDHAISRYLRVTLLSPSGGVPNHWSAEDALREINEACTQCLNDLGLWDWDLGKQPHEFSWYCVVQALDLAIVSFAGAHIEEFGHYLIGTSVTSDTYDIPGPCLQFPVHCTLQRRHLACLDNFFGEEPVWIFHPKCSKNTTNDGLYLSANMRDFSHIWGPIWGISASENLRSGVKRWDVGGGSIYPWPHTRGDPNVLPGEVFCHWLSADESESFDDRFRMLGVGDTLLIGAASLQVNHSCQTSGTDFESRLLNSNSLHDLRTTETAYYVDSMTSAMSLGGWGVNISGSKTFKRRSGQTLKSALLDRWSHDRDGYRMIQDLEKGYGLTMSFCSLNATRTTLFNLLRAHSRFDGISRYLEGFEWEDQQCLTEVLRILRKGTVQDLLAIYRENAAWRKSIREAIFWTLRMLSECSVDPDTRNVTIPWISGNSALAATFTKKEITWTGFLADTRDNSTFGLLVERCFAFERKGGRTCGQSTGKPVLQTQLRVNTTMRDNWMKLKIKPSGIYYWSISALYKKLRFPLGSQGSLTVLEVYAGCLLMEWTSEASTKAFFKKALQWNGGMHHQEYIAARWNAKDYPIQVFIESKYEIAGHRIGRSKGLGYIPKSPKDKPESSETSSSTLLNPLEEVNLDPRSKPIYEVTGKRLSPIPSSVPTQHLTSDPPRATKSSKRLSPSRSKPSNDKLDEPQLPMSKQPPPPISKPHSPNLANIPSSSNLPEDPGSSRAQLPSRFKPVNEASSNPNRQFETPQQLKSRSKLPNLPSELTPQVPEADEAGELGSTDDEASSSQVKDWKWDKKFKFWRRHVYTDGELDYTTWSRDPGLCDM